MRTYRKRKFAQCQAQVRCKGYPAQSKLFPTRAAAVRWVRSIGFEMDQRLFVSRHNADTNTVCGLSTIDS
jgi:hypothetical protein